MEYIKTKLISSHKYAIEDVIGLNRFPTGTDHRLVKAKFVVNTQKKEEINKKKTINK